MLETVTLCTLGAASAVLLWKGARKVYQAAAWWLSVCRDEREWEEAEGR